MSTDNHNPLLRGLPLLDDLPPLDGRSVLVRVDFNVPLRQCEGEPTTVADDFRIRSALPTLNYLLDQGASVTACTHLGRPKGAPDAKYDMAPVRDRLAELAPEVELLENLRFDAGEQANDPEFTTKLVHGHDAYVNEAFGVSHRTHASVVGPPAVLPSAAGFLLLREIKALGTLLGKPARPFVAVVGGAKVADKLGVLSSLLERVDTLIVGGGMAFTFLAAAGHDVGGSLVDVDRIDDCAAIKRLDHAHDPDLRILFVCVFARGFLDRNLRTGGQVTVLFESASDAESMTRSGFCLAPAKGLRCCLQHAAHSFVLDVLEPERQWIHVHRVRQLIDVRFTRKVICRGRQSAIRTLTQR